MIYNACFNCSNQHNLSKDGMTDGMAQVTILSELGRYGVKGLVNLSIRELCPSDFSSCTEYIKKVMDNSGLPWYWGCSRRNLYFEIKENANDTDHTEERHEP